MRRVPVIVIGVVRSVHSMMVSVTFRGDCRLVLVLWAMPHRYRSDAAQRQRGERHEQNQDFELNGHLRMLARRFPSLSASSAKATAF